MGSRLDFLAFNRTSLELKPHLLGRGFGRGAGAFNRTSLELKPRRTAVARVSVLPFNRTSLELKQVDTGIGGAMCKTFNRTSLELKRGGDCQHAGIDGF